MVTGSGIIMAFQLIVVTLFAFRAGHPNTALFTDFRSFAQCRSTIIRHAQDPVQR